MKLSQKDDTLVIDGRMSTGDIYLVHHTNYSAIQYEGPITCAKTLVTGWYCYRTSEKSRLMRFLRLLPVIWKFCK